MIGAGSRIASSDCALATPGRRRPPHAHRVLSAMLKCSTARYLTSAWSVRIFLLASSGTTRSAHLPAGPATDFARSAAFGRSQQNRSICSIAINAYGIQVSFCSKSLSLPAAEPTFPRPISAFSVAGSIRPHIDNNIATRNRHWRGCPNRAEWYWRSTQFFLPDAKRRIDGSQVADKMVRPDDIIK